MQLDRWPAVIQAWLVQGPLPLAGAAEEAFFGKSGRISSFSAGTICSADGHGAGQGGNCITGRSPPLPGGGPRRSAPRQLPRIHSPPRSYHLPTPPTRTRSGASGRATLASDADVMPSEAKATSRTQPNEMRCRMTGKLVGWATCCPCGIFFVKSLVKQAN